MSVAIWTLPRGVTHIKLKVRFGRLYALRKCQPSLGQVR